MLKIEKFVTASPEQMEMIIEGMRNPMNSWHLSDSAITHICDPETLETADFQFMLGEADEDLMMRLAKGGPVHAKYRRMMPIFVTITAPLYWWKEFDTYKVGTVANSCSTMHKIHAKEFTLEDFSCEDLITGWEDPDTCANIYVDELSVYPMDALCITVDTLNKCRERYLETKDKLFWKQMIQLLPTSYNQTRTVLLNYEVTYAMRKDRRHHKLTEWHVFCDFLESLPYSEVSAPED